jgi:hypothetical protein
MNGEHHIGTTVWFREIRRKRLARTMTRHVQWINQARQTPPVWASYEEYEPTRRPTPAHL